MKIARLMQVPFFAMTLAAALLVLPACKGESSDSSAPLEFVLIGTEGGEAVFAGGTLDTADLTLGSFREGAILPRIQDAYPAPDGSKAFVIADTDNEGRYELHLTGFSGTFDSQSTRLFQSSIANTWRVAKWSDDSRYVAALIGGFAGRDDEFVVIDTQSEPAAVIEIAPPVSHSSDLRHGSDFAFSPDSRKIAFYGNTDDAGQPSLLEFTIETNTYVTLAPALPGRGFRTQVAPVYPAENPNRVFAIADLYINEVYDLGYVDSAAPGTFRRAHGAFTRGAVRQFDVNSTGTLVVFTADPNTVSKIEPWVTDLAGSGFQTRIGGTVPALGDAQGIRLVDDSTAVIFGDIDMDNRQDVFLANVVTSPGVRTRISRFTGVGAQAIAEARFNPSNTKVLIFEGVGTEAVAIHCASVTDPGSGSREVARSAAQGYPVAEAGFLTDDLAYFVELAPSFNGILCSGNIADIFNPTSQQIGPPLSNTFHVRASRSGSHVIYIRDNRIVTREADGTGFADAEEYVPATIVPSSFRVRP